MEESTSDAELLRRCADEKSEAAFAELVRRYLNLVYSAALRQVGGDAHRAQDVAQVVFTTLARKASSLTGHPTLAGWLYTATQHAATKAMRTEWRRHAREQEAHAMQEILSPTTPAIDWARVRPVLDGAMNELGERDREAVLLRFFAARPFAEIGASLGLTEDAARMRVERSLEKLHALLARRGIASTTAALGLVLANEAAVAMPAGLLAGVTGTALAGAAAGSGGAIAVASIFMKTKTVLTSVVALLAIGFAVYEFNAARNEREAAAGARTELLAQLRAAQQRVAETDRQSAALRSELEAARAAKSLLGFKSTLAGAPTPASTPAPAVTAAPFGTGGFYLGSPKTPEEVRMRKGQNLDTAYAALYRELNLTPAQREQFKNLMLDVDEANQLLFGKAVAEAKARNPNFDRADQYEVFEALNAQTERDEQAAVRQALGETAAQALQNYQATGPMRVVANQLAANLFSSEAPLLPAQAEQLIEIMARNARGPAGKVDLVALNVEATAAQASGLLSLAQLAELRRTADRLVESAKAERERNIAPAASFKTSGK